MQPKSTDFIEVYSLQKELIDELSHLIDEECQSEVIRLFEHDEYEMSFEGLFLELINNNIHPKPFHFEKYKLLGEKLKLNTESILDYLFWKKFLKWGNTKT